MRITELTSKSNPVLRHVASLSEKKNRDRAGQYRFEGAKLFGEALRSGAVLRDVMFDGAAQESLADMLESAADAGASLYRVPRELLNRLTAAESGTPVVCCADIPPAADASLLQEGGLYLFAEQVQDAGNLGTMIRTAEAFGLDGLIAGEGCADLYSEKTVRAAMGSHFRLPVVRGMQTDALFDAAEKQHLAVFGAALAEDAQPVHAVRFDQGAVVAVGNEGRGLSTAFLNRCRRKIILPMAGPTESLNASVAAAVLMWEMTRSRRNGGAI